jgi:hypothetical protein
MKNETYMVARLLLLVGLQLGCSSESGKVLVSAYGEEFIEQGIPAASVDDGWAIEFGRFDITVSEATVGDATLPAGVTVDLTEPSDGEGQELGTLALAPGGYEESSFIIERIDVEGSASLDGETKTFAWTFDVPVAYDECETTTEVESDEAGMFQITVHADHLFYDSLVSQDPRLLFQPLADADLDEDGDITKAELGATGIGAYDPGSAGGIDDLWAFLQAQAKTLAHVDGEGHCHATALE